MTASALAIQPNDFLHSLCKWITGRANTAAGLSLNYADTTRPRDLFRNKIVEAAAVADPAPVTAVAMTQGGTLTWSDYVPRLRYQILTSGADEDAANARAQLWLETFTDADGHPVRSVTFSGFHAADDSGDGTWLLVSAEPMQRPGKIGVDGRGRAMIVFNVDLRFRKMS